MFTNKLFTSVVLAVILASSSSAAPSPPSPQHATHRVHKVKAGSDFTAYYPKSNYKTYGKGLDHALSKRAGEDLAGDAVKFVESQLHLSPNSVVFKSGFSNDIGKHAYLQQQINGVPVANAPAHVVFGNNGKVTAFGNSFIKPGAIPSTTPSINVQDAIQRAEAAVNGTYNQHPPSIEFVAKEDGSVVLAHVLQVENEHSGAFVEAFIDAHSGELAHLNNFVAEASYRVVPITKQYLTQGFETLVDPQDLTASPEGWHSDGRVSTVTTSGNNAIAFKGTLSAVTTQSSAPLNFIFNQTASQQPSVQVNVDAARTNAFYVVNTVHDISYKYGFKENAFNFQNNNFGKGGYGSDRVTISVQDSSGTNNANFATPPDGQSGRMRMYLFVITNPFRDGALENDIVIHEYTHGITNRLTGGGTANCLQTYESAGLGEGWSDAMADWMTHKDDTVPDFITGQYVTNNANGIRSFPYSTDPSVNPLTYASLQELNEVHDIGEVWANTLHNVYAALVADRGFYANGRTDPTSSAGNVIFLHNFIDALALQPCNPTFIQARDAWIQADVNRYQGANQCTLWKAFASKGLGVNAGDYENDTTLPDECLT